jgi:streptogrisin C
VTAYSASLNRTSTHSSPDRRSLLGAIAAAIAIAFFVPVVAPQTSDESTQSLASQSVANPQVAALMSDWGVSESEAELRLRRQDAIGRLGGALARHYPKEYGGLWIDHANGGAVTVAVTEPGIAPAMARRFGVDELVTEVVVERSLADLEAIGASVARQSDRVFKNADVLPTTVIDVKRNAVSVRFPHSRTGRAPGSGFARWLRRSYGSGVIVTRGHESLRDDACTGTRCDPPIRGGIRIRGSQACSTGFVVTTSAGRPAVTTAGHCPPNASGLYMHRTRVIGSTLASQDSGDVDARSVSIDDTTYWKPANWVLHQGFGDFPRDESLAITSRAVKSEIVLGQYLCRTGARSGTKCGEVTVLTSGPRKNNTGLVGVAVCAGGGDSGGPYYDYTANKAYGTHVQSGAGNCTGPETSYFSPIDSIERALGVTVLTQ